MRVDTACGWLGGELFHDDAPKVIKDNQYVLASLTHLIDADFRYLRSISLGPNTLAKLMDSEECMASEKLTCELLWKDTG